MPKAKYFVKIWSLIPVPICVYLSLLKVGTWFSESRVIFSVENLAKGAPDDAPDAPPVRPMWWVSRSALTGPAHSALSVSGEVRLVIYQGVS